MQLRLHTANIIKKRTYKPKKGETFGDLLITDVFRVLECWSDGVMVQGMIVFFYNTPILHFSITTAESYPIILPHLLLVPLLLFTVGTLWTFRGVTEPRL